MTYAEIQAVWQAAPDAPPPVPPDRLADLRTRAALFDRRILWRDLTEAAAAGVIMLVFGPTLLDGDAPSVARLGAAFAVGGAMFAIAWMWRARLRAPRPSPALPPAEAVRVALARVEVQVRLVRTVAWWYLLPLSVGPFIEILGSALPATRWTEAPAMPFEADVVVAAVILMGGLLVWVYRLNQRAVRDELIPLRDRLAALLTDLTSDPR
ncbi:MAG: hypothetical protein AAF845_00405 [Bacteroidota bacterium]